MMPPWVTRASTFFPNWRLVCSYSALKFGRAKGEIMATTWDFRASGLDGWADPAWDGGGIFLIADSIGMYGINAGDPGTWSAGAYRSNPAGTGVARGKFATN